MDHERRAGKPEEDSRENNVAGGRRGLRRAEKLKEGQNEECIMRYDGHRGEIWRGNRSWEAGDLKFHQFFFILLAQKGNPASKV